VIDAGGKPARAGTVGGVIRPIHQLRDEEYVQAAVGKAEAMLGAARGFCLKRSVKYMTHYPPRDQFHRA
jgi:hypothetical protein